MSNNDIINNKSEEDLMISSDPDFLSKYSNLDQFQLNAFDLIKNFSVESNSNSSNVLVTAHTGSGKSLVAEYGIYHTVKERKKKVIYTSPIKSLSNQKFYDFNEKFSKYDISIGILTGDIKFAPQADCVIMTTEILLNQLMRHITKSSGKVTNSEANIDMNVNFDDIGTIVFDEVHYINDIDRGNVWEQSIMYIPNNIQLLMLSATLNQPATFGKWIESVQHKPTVIISTTHRVVPLYFNVYYGMSSGVLKNVPKEKHKIFKFNELIEVSNTNTKKFDSLTYDKIIKFNTDLQKSNNFKSQWKPQFIINDMLKNFNHENYYENMFPLLFFLLNKKKCMQLATKIDITFNNREEQVKVKVEQFIDYTKRTMGLSYLDNLEQFKIIKELAIKGIGIHHSGLLPIIKEIIEQLYEKKLIKVLFATETFAVGLNMPTKTVVFTDLSKYSSGGYRLLHSHEFIQMAGRAGRRNIDEKGYVILLPQLFKEGISSTSLSGIVNGTGQQIISKLNIDELLILRLLKANPDNATIEKLASYVENSMLASNNKSQISHQRNIVRSLEDFVQEITLGSDDINKLEEFDKFKEMGYVLNKTQKKEFDKITKANPNYRNQMKNFQEYNKEKDILTGLEQLMINNIREILNILYSNKMIEYNDNNYIILTNRGDMGALILDLNPILIIDIITSDFFDKLDKYNMITLLSAITFDDHSDNSTLNSLEYYYKSNDNITWIESIKEMIAKYSSNDHTKHLLPLFNFDYIWLVDDFIRTSVYSSKSSDQDYLFEGNFMRSISRVVNLLTEIEQICDKSNYDLIQKLNNCVLLLKQDWLNPDSIYLKQSGTIIKID